MGQPQQVLDLVARFRAGARGCRWTDDRQRVGICLSGGADSLALLWLAQSAYADVFAATVDHALRPQSHDEAQMAGAICASIGVPHQILTIGKPPTTGNVSAWARDARYAALSSWAAANGIAGLMTAHHADDQLETMLMRLNRGAGVAGLAGVRSQRAQIFRPLLGWRKTELEAIVSAQGWEAVIDPSNSNLQYDRAKVRLHLSAAPWLDPIAASKSAQALAQAEDALKWASDQYFSAHAAIATGVLTMKQPAVPAEIKRRVALRCLCSVNPEAAPRGDAVERLLLALDEGRTVTLSGVKCSGGATWRFTRARNRENI